MPLNRQGAATHIISWRMLTMNRWTLAVSAAWFALASLLAGCSGARVMMQTPNVHLDENRDFYGNLPNELQSSEVRIFYVTDRAPEEDEQGNLAYGSQRSNSLGLGSAVVDLGENLSWEELLEASRTQKRLGPVELKLRDVEELDRSPPIPIPYTEVDGRVVEEPDLAAARDAAIEGFRSEVAEQLALTPRKDVFVYVHGYHNTFGDSLFAMAELWHFLGRIGVPIVYSWPAGYPGIFGYTYDRESSEFTVYHLRRVIRAIASFPEVERIHVIAHSRGTDVATNALRELSIAARAAGLDPKVEFKIHNFVLAAPDIDVQVAEQRLIGDRLAISADRFTMYTSPVDKAIGFSTKLFESPRGRIGRYDVEHSSELTKNAMEFGEANFAIITFSGVGDAQSDRYGHSYFRDAPTVSSDLVLMLRDDIDAGEPERPLKHEGLNFWSIPEVYPPRN